MNNPSNTPPDILTEPCETCGQPAEMIPYMDFGGCGSAVIELWRCPAGHVRYGNKLDQASCDFDRAIKPDSSTDQL